MEFSHEIKNISGEDVLYIYVKVEDIYEFGKENLGKGSNTNFLNKLRDYIKNNIVETKKAAAIIVINGVIVGTLTFANIIKMNDKYESINNSNTSVSLKATTDKEFKVQEKEVKSEETNTKKEKIEESKESTDKAKEIKQSNTSNTSSKTTTTSKVNTSTKTKTNSSTNKSTSNTSTPKTETNTQTTPSNTSTNTNSNNNTSTNTNDNSVTNGIKIKFNDNGVVKDIDLEEYVIRGCCSRNSCIIFS